MADDRIKLGLDASEAVYQLDTLATKFDDVKASASNVTTTYDLLDAETADLLVRMRDTVAAFGDAEEGVNEVAAVFQVAARRTEDLRHEAIQLADSVEDAGQTYVVVADQFEAMVDDEVRAARKAEAAIDGLNRSKRRAGTESDALGRTAGRTADRMNELARGGLQASQAMQDIAQGGLASGLNNVDGIVGSLGRGLGLSAGAATVLSGGLLAVGTAALVFGPAIWEWVNALSKGNEEIPETKSAMDKLSESLATAKGRVEAMKAAWHGTKEEVEKYKTAQAEVIALEKQAAEQKTIDAQKAKEAAGVKEVDKPYAEAASKAVEGFGGVEKFQETMERIQPTGFREDYARKIKEATEKRARDAQQAYEDSGYNHEAGDAAFDRGTKDIEVLQGLLKQAEEKRKADAASETAKFLEGDVGIGRKLEGIFPGRGFDVGGTVQKQRAEELAELQRQVEAKEAADAAKEATARQAKREQNRKDEAKDEAEYLAQVEKDKAEFDAEQAAAGKALEAEDKAAADAAKAQAEAQAIGQEGADKAGLQDAARQFGVDIPSEQLGGVLDSFRGYAAMGATKDQALMGAIGEWAKAQEQAADKLNRVIEWADQQRARAARIPNTLEYGGL